MKKDSSGMAASFCTFQATCHTGIIFFGASTVLKNKKDRSTPALTQARDDMKMLLAVLTPIIGVNR
jgi:hypothetical protein